MQIFNPKRLLLLLSLLCSMTGVTQAQKFPISIPASLTTKVAKSGKYSLEVKSGGSVESYLELKPNSTYKLSVLMKTSSGADEVQVNVIELAENNVSEASALADWALIEKELHPATRENR